MIDGEEVYVIAKLIPNRELAVELICSCIGREVGLPIPEPVLLLDADHRWFFASVDTGHPNLQQVATCSDAAIISKLELWPGLLKAACFDEWIANSDRGDGNLLFDGNGFILIDHGLAIPQGMNADDWSDDYYNNHLLDVVNNGCGRSEPVRAQKANEALEWSSQVGRFSSLLDDEALPDLIDSNHRLFMSKFLTDRIAKLGSELYRKLNPSQGALNLND